VALFFFWIPQFADLIHFLAERFQSGPARQVANAHTIFNVGLGLLFLPCTPFFGNLILRILPDKIEDNKLKPATWHLDDSKITSPAIAIDLARTEISHMAKLIGRMQRAIIVPFLSSEPRRDEFHPGLSLIEGIKMREHKVNFLQEKITNYLLQISKQELSDEESKEVFGMISIVKDMESLGDLIDRNMIPMIPKKQNLESDFSHEGKEELLIYHEKVCNQIYLLREALAERSPEKAQEIMASEKKYLDLESQYRIRHLERLRHERRESLETHSVHLELMDLMKQIIVYSSNIAKTFIASCGQGQPDHARAELQSRSLLKGVDFLGGLIQKEH
jgi:phosphate:Na+ symporter